MAEWNVRAHNNPYVDSFMMENMRERIGLDSDDASRDQEILTMSPRELLGEMLEWEGIIGYTRSIIDMIYYAYGVDLETYTNNMAGDYRREITPSIQND